MLVCFAVDEAIHFPRWWRRHSSRWCKIPKWCSSSWIPRWFSRCCPDCPDGRWCVMQWCTLIWFHLIWKNKTASRFQGQYMQILCWGCLLETNAVTMDAMRYRGLEVRQRYQWFQRWLLHKRSILMCKDGSSSAFIHTWFPTVVPPQRLSSMINSERIKFINWIIQHPRSRFFLGSGKSGHHQPGVDSKQKDWQWFH